MGLASLVDGLEAVAGFYDVKAGRGEVSAVKITGFPVILYDQYDGVRAIV